MPVSYYRIAPPKKKVSQRHFTGKNPLWRHRNCIIAATIITTTAAAAAAAADDDDDDVC